MLPAGPLYVSKKAKGLLGNKKAKGLLGKGKSLQI